MLSLFLDPLRRYPLVLHVSRLRPREQAQRVFLCKLLGSVGIHIVVGDCSEECQNLAQDMKHLCLQQQ